MSQAEVRLDLGMMPERDLRTAPNPEEIINHTHANNLGVLTRKWGYQYYVRTDEANFDNTVKGDGIDTFYKANGDTYVFVPKGVNLQVEKNGTWLTEITGFFDTAPDRVRGKSFNDRFWFVDANNVLRWYKEYDGSAHIWAIALLDRPYEQISDNAGLDYGYGSTYEDHVDHWAGIERLGIWQYKQTFELYGDDYQILQEGNSSPASKRMFVAQWNTDDGSAGYGVGLEGYVKSGVPLLIAGSDNIGNIAPNKRRGLAKSTIIYRRWKAYADDLFSPWQKIYRLPYDWSDELTDGAERVDAAVNLLDNNDQAPIAEYIDVFNRTLFLGKIVKPTGAQPLISPDFRGIVKDNMRYILVGQPGANPGIHIYDGFEWTTHSPTGSEPIWYDCDISDDGTKFIAVEAGGYVWTYDSSTGEWDKHEPNPDNSSPNWECVRMSADGTKYIACTSGLAENTGEIWVSVDSGANWTEEKPRGETDARWFGVDISDDGLKMIACCDDGFGATARVYVDDGGGGGWVDVEPTGDEENAWIGCAMSADGTKYCASNGGFHSYAPSSWTDHTATFQANCDIWRCDISDDGTKFIVGDLYWNYACWVYDGGWVEHEPWGVGNNEFIYSLSMLPDGSKFMVCGDSAGGGTGVPRVWNGAAWENLPSGIDAGIYNGCAMATVAGSPTGDDAYSPNFSYRVPITVTNSDDKVHTRAVVPIKLQTDDDTSNIASSPDCFESTDYTGAYLETSLTLGSGDDWWQMVFTDSDGVTPVGHCKVDQDAAGGNDRITFMVEVPELQRGENTIYLYFEDVGLAKSDPESAPFYPGHYSSVYHRPLLYSDQLFNCSFEEGKDYPSGDYVARSKATNTIGKRTNTFLVTELTSASPYYGNTSAWTNLSTQTSTTKDCVGRVDYHASTSEAEFQQGTMPTDIKGKTLLGLVKVSAAPTANMNILSHGRQTSGGDQNDTLLLYYLHDATPANRRLQAKYIHSGGGTTTIAEVALPSDTFPTDWFLIWGYVDYKSQTVKIGYAQQDTAGHWAGSGTIENDTDTTPEVALNDVSSEQDLGLHQHPNSPQYTLFDNVICVNGVLSDNEALSYWWQETYQPNGGLTVLGDVEDLSATKTHINEVVWSKQNKPDAFPLLNLHKVGDEGEPVTGIIGFGNFVTGFTESKIRPMLARSSTDVVAGVSIETTTYELLKDVTRELGGVGCIAPDTLIVGEIMGNPGVMFLSARGIELFTGKLPILISEGANNLITDNTTVAERRLGQMIYHPLRRRLFLGFRDANDWVIVGDSDVLSRDPGTFFLWKKWDEYYADYFALKSMSLDNGELLWTSHKLVAIDKYLMYEDELNAPYYLDELEESESGSNLATASVKSNIFLVGDAEIQEVIIEQSGTLSSLKVYLDGTPTTILNVSDGRVPMPWGSHAKEIQFELIQGNTSSELRRFYFNYKQHKRRRL